MSSLARNILLSLDMDEIYSNRLPVNFNMVVSELNNIQQNDWRINVQNKPKLRFYSKFKSDYEPEVYIKMNLDKNERSLLAQLRLGILPLHIETGRYNQTAVEDRLCNICNSNEVEDEAHFLFNCSAYTHNRSLLFETLPQVTTETISFEDKLKLLLREYPRQTAKFINKSMAIRRNMLYV